MEAAMILTEQISLMDKLKILSDAAKYDVECTSSGVNRTGKAGTSVNCIADGIGPVSYTHLDVYKRQSHDAAG